ncbi:MAG: type II toxin-antitoxin system VapC family toxin, partial [Actinomycetes bacterium]
MIIVDTNVLVALTDRDDQFHSRCRRWLETTEATLLVPSTVLAEVCYLLDRELGPATEAAFLDDVGTTGDHPYQLVDLVDTDLRRMAELVRRYADRR